MLDSLSAPRRDVVTAEILARMVSLRRDLHQRPELAHDEHLTAARVCAELEGLGLTVRTGVAGTGIVAELAGARSGPAIALRADMDALPIAEATGLSFASVHPGVMHACGHDGHSAMLLGAALLLLDGPPPPLPVRLIWQPAEELGAGALAMREAGVLDGVAAIFGGHVDNRYPVGTIIVSEGAVNASTDGFRLTVRGRGGHAARPHETTDAVVVGAALVGALQTVVAREIDPAHPAVLSVCSFHAGRAPNVIADQAVLEGTLRALDPAVRGQLRAALGRVASGVAASMGALVEVVLHDGTPPVINTPDMAALAGKVAASAVGAARVLPLRGANLGGEDFGWYLERVPGAFVRFGAGTPGREAQPAHSCRFDLDEGCLATGALWMAGVARAAGARFS